MTDVDLETMIASVRKLGAPSFLADVAKEAREGVLEAVRATAARGAAPDGTAWRLRKEDGAQALKSAAAKITARVIGSIIQLEVPYPYSIHHNQEGTATRPRRQILPDGDKPLPASVVTAVNAAVAKVFARTMGGR